VAGTWFLVFGLFFSYPPLERYSAPRARQIFVFVSDCCCKAARP